ncbi:MAG TPA: hypothetical protein RMH99_19935 [Sandaracinaceae bacterium LLY-WYZ-13_1]|nr:hypothetical protein [Sandaracinaceae bacterium LLY-WYZ-13_1]
MGRSAAVALVTILSGACAAASPPVRERVDRAASAASDGPVDSEEPWVPVEPLTGGGPPSLTLPSPRPVPESLPAWIGDALAAALANGYLDPRLGTPRRVEVATSDVWRPEVRPRRTVAFVLPTAGGSRYAAAGGHLYRLVSVGPPVDLAAECVRTVRLLEALGPMPSVQSGDRARWFEERDAARDGCPMLDAGLVLGASHPELSAAVASHAFSEGSDATTVVRWVLAVLLADAFELAVTAHMRGDDLVARRESGLVARGLPRVRRLLAGTGVTEERLDEELRYLEVADALYADQERRARAPDPPPLPSIPESGPVPPGLVPALVAHLEEVQVGQGGQPGGVALQGSSIVDALVRVGGEAVPVLIDTLEHDDRLTRSVQFWRDFAPSRTVLGVHEAAYAALVEILGASFFRPAATGDDRTSRGSETRAELAARLRRYWTRYGQHPPLERHYRILRDDDADRARQLESARWLSLPAGTHRPPGSMTQTPPVGGATGPARGEPLRGARSPSVSELLARRILETRDDPDGLGHACRLAESFAAWSATEAARSLAPFGRRCVAAPTCPCVGPLLVALGRAHPQLLARYARRLAGTAHPTAAQLLPWVAYPDHEGLRRAVGDLLLGDGPLAPRADVYAARNVVRLLSELDALERPLAREHLRAGLALDAEVGRLSPRNDGGWVEYDGGAFSVELPEPATGERRVRAADLYAHALFRHLQIPFSLGWPRARRDAAIAAMAERLAS